MKTELDLGLIDQITEFQDNDPVFVEEGKQFKICTNNELKFLVENETEQIYCPAKQVVGRQNIDGVMNLYLSGYTVAQVLKSDLFETSEGKETVLSAIEGTPFTLLEGCDFVLINKIGVIVCRGLSNIVEFLKTAENE